MATWLLLVFQSSDYLMIGFISVSMIIVMVIISVIVFIKWGHWTIRGRIIFFISLLVCDDDYCDYVYWPHGYDYFFRTVIILWLSLFVT